MCLSTTTLAPVFPQAPAHLRQLLSGRDVLPCRRHQRCRRLQRRYGVGQGVYLQPRRGNGAAACGKTTKGRTACARTLLSSAAEHNPRASAPSCLPGARRGAAPLALQWSAAPPEPAGSLLLQQCHVSHRPRCGPPPPPLPGWTAARAAWSQPPPAQRRLAGAACAPRCRTAARSTRPASPCKQARCGGQALG